MKTFRCCAMAKVWLGVFLFCSLMVVTGGISRAASDADIDRLTSYAVILGRGAACGEKTQDAARRVGEWVERTFYGKERSDMMAVLALGMIHHAEQQSKGNSPDSCSSVSRTFSKMTWP